MKILAIECSSSPVSAALVCDGEILSHTFSNTKVTHSQTLFPVIESTLGNANLNFSDIDAISVSTGPGSFTGIRIGLATAKGLAQPKDLKCVGVSSLLAAAYMFLGENAIVCPVIDARCNQVYTAFFEVSGNKVDRLSDDGAVTIDELVSKVKRTSDKKIILSLDAAKTVFNSVRGQANVFTAPEMLLSQSALGVALYAQKAIENGDYTDYNGLVPVYLKLPQAERELRAKTGKEENL